MSDLYNRYLMQQARVVEGGHNEQVAWRWKDAEVRNPNLDDVFMELIDHGVEASKPVHAYFEALSKVSLGWELNKRCPAYDAVHKDPWMKGRYKDYGKSFIEGLFSGDIKLHGLTEMIAQHESEAAPYKLSLARCQVDGKPADVSEFFPIEYHWGLVALIRKDASGTLTDNVWLLHEQGMWLREMNITLAHYAECALRVRGFQHWQLAYLDRQDEVYARMMFALPKLFPKENFDSVFER